MRYGSAKTALGFSMNCAAGKNVGQFCFFNNSAKNQPIKLKSGSHVVQSFAIFVKGKMFFLKSKRIKKIQITGITVKTRGCLCRAIFHQTCDQIRHIFF